MDTTSTITSSSCPENKLLMSAREVCATLSISNTTLWRLVQRGLLKPHPGFRHKLYSVAAIRRFAEKTELTSLPQRTKNGGAR